MLEARAIKILVKGMDASSALQEVKDARWWREKVERQHSAGAVWKCTMIGQLDSGAHLSIYRTWRDAQNGNGKIVPAAEKNLISKSIAFNAF